MRAAFLIGQLFLLALFIVATRMSTNLSYFIDIPSLLLMVFGTLAMTLMSFTWNEIRLAAHHIFADDPDLKALRLSAYFWECMVRNILIIAVLCTIVGFISMIAVLEDPAQLSRSMAQAFMTVFYAFLFSAILPIPAYFSIRKRILARKQQGEPDEE